MCSKQMLKIWVNNRLSYNLVLYYMWKSSNMICNVRIAALRYILNYYDGYKTSMRVARLRNVPPVPATLQELAQILTNYQPLRNLYKGSAVGTDGPFCLIFMDDRMLDALSRCNHLFCDGTFDVSATILQYPLD